MKRNLLPLLLILALLLSGCTATDSSKSNPDPLLMQQPRYKKKWTQPRPCSMNGTAVGKVRPVMKKLMR